MISSLLILAGSFVVLWISTGISISAIEKLSKKIHIPSFLTSFFALGLLTSLSEISIAFFSTIDKTPSISVGNLLGASVVITLLIIPLQVLSSKDVPVNTKSDQISLTTAYFVISLPVILILDKTLSTVDAILIIFSYLYLLLTISNKKALIINIENSLVAPKTKLLKEISKLVVGSILVIVSSRLIVINLVSLSEYLHLSQFIIGLVVLSLGTSIPELAILIRSYIFKDRSVALGDYIGSASLNVLILGLLILANGGSISINGGVKYNLLLLPLGAGLFLFFAKNKKFEQKEAFVLVFLYASFVALELFL